MHVSFYHTAGGITRNITGLIDLPSFPDYFDESMKGSGYFEYEVKPITFKVNVYGSENVFALNDTIKIINDLTGEPLLVGKIDEIMNGSTFQPELTVFPQAIYFKDTVIGDDLELSTGETVKDYPFNSRHIRDTVNDIITRINTEHGTNLYCDDTSIPDAPNEGTMFATTLKKVGGFSFTQMILSSLGLSDRLYTRINAGGQFFLIHQDGRVYQKRILRKGQWGDFSWGFTLFGTEYGFDWGSIPSSDVSIPWIGSTHHVWSMINGSLEYIGDFDDDNQFGDVYSGIEFPTMDESKYGSYGAEEGMTNVSLLSGFEYNERSNYGIIRGNYKNDFLGHDVAVSFDLAFDDNYGGHYRNATAMDIIRDIAVVANRWFYVDREGKVYLLPRSQSRGSVTYAIENTLSETKKVKKEGASEITLVGYEETDDGKVRTYGLKLRKTEIEVILNRYKEMFSNDITTREIELYKVDADDILKTVHFDYVGEDIGTVIAISHSFLKPLTKVTVENV